MGNVTRRYNVTWRHSLWRRKQFFHNRKCSKIGRQCIHYGNRGTTSSGDIDTSEHVVITYMVTGDKPDGKSAERLDEMMEKLNAILTEKVNAELEIYYIGWTDYLSNYNLTLAQMDGSVDLVGTASDWLDAWPNAKN